VIQFIAPIYSLNWTPIEIYARDHGYADIIAYASGTDMPISQDIFDYRDNPVGEGEYYRDYDLREDDNLDVEDAYEDANNWIIDSRMTDAFRNTRFTPYNLDVDSGSGEAPMEGVDEDNLPEEAMPLDDNEPFLTQYGWGFRGYNITNVDSAEDEDERSILALAYGSRVFL
jgi:hypothetical protein